LNVSERAREFIEGFEPGVHQFLPVDYFDRQERFLERRHFLIVCNRIDSLDRKHSRMRLVKDIMWSPDGVTDPKIVFNRSQCGNAHLWVDKHLMGGPWISDELAEELKGIGLSGLRLSDTGVETV
jgi:hypothetical protein